MFARLSLREKDATRRKVRRIPITRHALGVPCTPFTQCSLAAASKHAQMRVLYLHAVQRVKMPSHEKEQPEGKGKSFSKARTFHACGPACTFGPHENIIPPSQATHKA